MRAHFLGSVFDIRLPNVVSPFYTTVEMPSVLLMAAVRNIQLVRLLFHIDSDKAIQLQ